MGDVHRTKRGLRNGHEGFGPPEHEEAAGPERSTGGVEQAALALMPEKDENIAAAH
jgi:hypothetical protein